MDLRSLFEQELASHDIEWCRGTPLEFCEYRNSHTRGFAAKGVVHYSAQIATRTTFFTGLHEIGHIVLGHDRKRGRRYEREEAATRWAITRMKEMGVPIPRKAQAEYATYVARMKRWGDNIAAGH